MGDNIPGANPSPDTGPSVLVTPFDQTRTTPETFGAGTGDLVQKQGAQLGQRSLDYLDRANQVADLAVFGKAQKTLNDVILDPKQGYLSLRGADAIAKGGEAQDKFKQEMDKLRERMSDAQTLRIGYRLDRLQETGIQEAATHERHQHGVVAEASAKGTQDQILQTIATMAANPLADPKTLREQFGLLAEAGKKLAAFRYGDSATPDVVQAATLPMLQAGAVTAMTSAINRPGVTANQAQRLFDLPFGNQKLGDLLGEHRGTIERAMGNIRSADTTEFEGSKLIGQATDKATGWVNPDRLQALLTKMPETPAKGDITKYVHMRLQEALSFRKDQVDAHLQQVWKAGDQGDGTLDLDQVKKNAPLTAAWMQTHAPKEWGELELRVKREATAEERANRAATPEENRAFLDAQWALATSPEEFARMTPAGFDARWSPVGTTPLAPKDYRALGTLWREGLQKAATEPNAVPPTVLATAVDIGRQAGVFPSGKKPPKDWGQDQKALYDSLNTTLLEKDAAFKRDNGRKMNVKELADEAVKHLVGVKVPRSVLPGTTVQTALTLEKEGVSLEDIQKKYEIATVPGVPDKAVAKIVARMKKGGYVADATTIRTAYQRDPDQWNKDNP